MKLETMVCLFRTPNALLRLDVFYVKVVSTNYLSFGMYLRAT